MWILYGSSVADQEGGAEDQKSQSAVFTIPEKAVPEQSVGDVGITQLDWKRVPQARSCGCKVVAITAAECSRHHASRNDQIVTRW